MQEPTTEHKLAALTWVRLFEIALMPFVIAAVGGLATFFVTKYQSQNAERIASAQLVSAERMAAVEIASAERNARSERELKALELFSRMIASNSVREREMAVRLLRAIDEDLAGRLARAIAADQAESSGVRAAAQAVVNSLRSGYAFPVVGAYERIDDATAFARKLVQGRASKFQPEVYSPRSGYYVVTLGGYLDYPEAAQRAGYARQNGIAADALVYDGRDWGTNLLK